MSDLFCEFGEGFQFDENADLVQATGFTETRQEIQRYLLTNQALTLPSGIQSPADNKFDPTFGAGLRRYLGQLAMQPVIDLMQRACVAACLQSPNVTAQPPPVVSFNIQTAFSLLITIDVWTEGNWNTLSTLVD